MPDAVKMQAAQQSFDAQLLARQFPTTAQLLANPDYMRLAHDDIPATTAVEQHVQALGAPSMQPGPGFVGPQPDSLPGASIGPDTSPPSYRDRLTAWFRDLVGAEPAGRDEGAAARAFLDLEAKRQGVSRNDLREAIGGVSPIPQQFANKYITSQTAGLAPDVAGEPDTTGGQVAAGAGTLAGFLVGAPLKIAEAVVEKTAGPLLARTAGESFVKGLGKDVTRQAATLGLASGLSAAGQALDTGTPGGAVDAVLHAGESGAGMGAVFGAAGRLFPENTAAQLFARILGTNAALDAMSGARPWDDRPLAQKVFDYGLNTFFSLNGAGRTAGGWLHDAARADAATQDGKILGGLAEASSLAKLRERDPELFKQFVASAAQDGPVPNVYVDGTVLHEALAQSGIGMDELAAKMPDAAKQLPEALATGGQVKIPVEDFATHLAGSVMQDALLPHLRTDPEAMTATEAVAFYQSHTDELKAQVERLTAQHAEDQPFIDSQKQVQDQVLSQLDATGRFRPEVNQAYAAMTRDFYTAMAGRTGMLPHELYEKYPLKIGAESMAGEALAQGAPAERDVVNPIDRSATPAEKLRQLKELTAENRPLVKGLMSELDTALPGTKSSDSVKADEKILSKAQRPAILDEKPWHGVEHIRDAYRFKTVLDHIDQLPKALDVLLQKGAQVVKADVEKVLSPKELGWRIAVFDLRMPNGQLVEWYLPIKEMEAAKKDGGHALFEKVRNNDMRDPKQYAEYHEVAAQSRAHYEKAFDAYLARTASDATAVRASLDKAKALASESRSYPPSEVKSPARVLGAGEDQTPSSERTAENPSAVNTKATLEPGASETKTVASGTADITTTSEAILRSEEGAEGAAGPPERGPQTAAGVVDTPAFKAWFGDESTLRNDDGSPMVLYHGTTEGGSFTEFKASGTGAMGRGVYLGDDPSVADTYAADGASDTGANVLPVYARGKYLTNHEWTDYIQKYGSKEAGRASEAWAPAERAARADGWSGVHDTMFEDAVVVWDPKDIKSAIGNSGAFDPNDPSILKQAARGAFSPDTRTITLLKGADLSTFLHESGHFFLDTLSRIAAEPDAPAGIRDDMAAALQWMGHEGDAASWRDLSLNQQREGHEQFARGFEAYLLEGKAPSFELRTLFARFRSWLLNVYKSLSALKVDLTPEVRGVFDRMLASQDAIDQAEQARRYMPLFDSPEKAAMTPEQWTEYQSLGTDATDEAVTELTAKTVRDMAWSDRVRSSALKDLASAAAEKRKAVRREVEAEVDKQPVYGAARFLKRGEVLDAKDEASAPAEQHRLDIDSLKTLYSDSKDAPDWQKLGYGKYGMLGEKGLPPDLVADMFGYRSGDELVRALLDAEPRRQVVAGLTEQRMLEKYGEIATPIGMAEAADLAVHNDVRARFVATELKALNKSLGSVRDLAKAAKEVAETTIAGRKVRDISDRTFLAAETKAGKEAEKRLAAGDTAGAAVAKRDQLLNGALARAARDAQKAVEKGTAYLKRFDKDSIRAKVDVDIRDQIDSLLERFDLRQKPPEGPTRAQKSLADWAEGQQAAGYAPSIPTDLLDPTVREHFKDMPVERFTGLVDSIKALEQIGKSRRELAIDGKKTDLDEYVNTRLVPKMLERGERFSADKLTERPEDRHTNPVAIAFDHFTAWLRGAAAQLKPQEFKRNEYDRHEILGPFGEALTDPVINANYRKVEMLRGLSNDFQKAADELGRPWQDSLRETMRNSTLPDPDRSMPANVPLRMTRGRMIGIAIHVGNESNFDKLTKGWGWAPADVWAFLHENMSAKDWRAAQTVWDLYEKHWPEMEAMNRRLGNESPERIEPRPFQTRFGEMRGGYAAIAYDALRSRRGEKDAAGQAINPAQGLFGRDYFRADTTTNGSMNSRIDGYTDRVDLDFHTIARKLHESIHDLAYRETLINANKVIEHPDFRKAFRAAYGREAYSSLQDWIGQLANSENTDRQVGALGKFLQYTRTGMVINAIAFRATTVLKHGVSAASKTMGYFVGGGEKYLASRMASMGTDYANQIAGAREKFGEIANRLQQQDRDFKATATTLFEPDKAIAKAHRFGHAAVAWSDMLTAVPTAWAAYDRAVTEGIPVSQGGTGAPMTEAQAVNYANKVVREAHGSTAEAARSMALNTSNEALKMFTTLYGFMNNSYGQQLDAFDKLRTEGISNGPVLARTFMVIVVPAIWAAYLQHGGSKDQDGWAAWLGKALAGEVASSVPFVRDAVGMVEGFHNAGMVAAENWLSTMINAGKALSHAGDGKGKPIREVADAAGMGLHIPGLGQLGMSIQYARDVQTGKEHPRSSLEYAKGLLTGHGIKH